MAVPNPSHFPAVASQLRRLRYRGVNGSYYLDNAGQSGLGFPDVTRDPSSSARPIWSSRCRTAPTGSSARSCTRKARSACPADGPVAWRTTANTGTDRGSRHALPGSSEPVAGTFAGAGRNADREAGNRWSSW